MTEPQLLNDPSIVIGIVGIVDGRRRLTGQWLVIDNDQLMTQWKLLAHCDGIDPVGPSWPSWLLVVLLLYWRTLLVDPLLLLDGNCYYCGYLLCWYWLIEWLLLVLIVIVKLVLLLIIVDYWLTVLLLVGVDGQLVVKAQLTQLCDPDGGYWRWRWMTQAVMKPSPADPVEDGRWLTQPWWYC